MLLTYCLWQDWHLLVNMNNKTVSFSVYKKDSVKNCFAILWLDIKVILILFPISFVLFVYFLIVRIMATSEKEITILLLSSLLLMCFMLLLIIVYFYRLMTQYKKLFVSNDKIEFKLSRENNKIILLNLITNIASNFDLNDVLQTKIYREILIIKLKNKKTIVLPRQQEIEEIIKK